MEIKIVNREADNWGLVFGLSNRKEIELTGSIIFLQWYLDGLGELEALERLAQAANSLEEFITLQKSFNASSMSVTTLRMMGRQMTDDQARIMVKDLLEHALAGLESL